MTKTRRITPHEWIQDYFSPVVGVLSSPEAEALCRKNNLTLTEILQPFSRLPTDVTLKDADGLNHGISNLNVSFQDFKKDPSRLIAAKLVSDTVNYVHDEPSVTREFNGKVLEAPGFTPWFDAFSKLTFAAIPALEHEFLRNHIGCVFAATSGDKNPVETLKTLTQMQYKHQHERTGAATPNSYPQYITPNVLKFYVLLHDVHEVPEAKAHENFNKIQAAFGQGSCHLLQINSGAANTGNAAVAEHWINHCTSTHRFCNVEARLAAIVGTTTTLLPLPSTEKPSTNNDAQSVDHPLALEDEPVADNSSTEPVKLVPATMSNTALYLNANDIERIRIFVRE